MLNVAATMFPAFSKAIKTDHKLQSIIESHPTVTLWAFVVALVGLIVVTALVMLQCVYVCRHWPELRKFRWWMRIPVFMVFAILSLTLIVMVGMGFLAGLSAT